MANPTASQSTRSSEPLHATSSVGLLNQSSEQAPFKRVKKAVETRKKQQGPSKKYRTTYDIRKQQKSDLVAKVARLQREVNLLKHRVLIEQGEAYMTIQRTKVANSVLRECVQDQHVTIAAAKPLDISDDTNR
ncbi:uncharacterized protein KRP23_1204 [Phytophthora ramorum]|uniref:uncharacterized protein n=1 Tax=Phytophthora ramorum TaxID=164328 RepID=UPI00309C5335|nr:hypothetical protein KRP23_1204 [Phytophthora ramorum]